MIERFRPAQDRAVAFVREELGPALGVRFPRSDVDWVAVCLECGLYGVRTVNGHTVFAHGFGIAIDFPDLTIDFDWGERGEPDGFDAWRLWIFHEDNGLLSHLPDLAQVREWLIDAAAAGELTRDRSLFYSPAHRSEGR